jgi:outer membrane protein OmpA-like peptidoglycan-associated protein
MTSWLFGRLGLFTTVLSALLLSACQTVSTPHRFSAEQVAELQQQGFVPNGDSWELSMADRLLFDVDSAALQPQMAVSLERIANGLIGVGIRSARVEGHTDSTGSAHHNIALSHQRARRVAETLSTHGFRVAINNWGESRPIADNGTEQGRQLNRRVVIIVSPE